MALPHAPQFLFVIALFILFVVVVSIAAIAFGLLLFPLIERLDEPVRKQLSQDLEANGWQAVAEIPERALKAMFTSEFRLKIPMTEYVCTHSVSLQNVCLYIGIAKWGGGGRGSAGEWKNTVFIASADVHAPVDCLVALNNGPLEGFFEDMCILRLHSEIASRPDLFVHFKSHVSIDDPEVDRTLKIVRSLFNGAEEVFSSASVALVAKDGFLIRGPVLSTNRAGMLSVAPLVRGSQRLLANCANAIQSVHARHAT